MQRCMVVENYYRLTIAPSSVGLQGRVELDRLVGR